MAEIQAQGGLTFAQDEDTAKYDAMPQSAIQTGCADYILPPQGIARELARLARHPYVVRGKVPEVAPMDHSGLNAIFQLLRRTTGVDFTYYRQSTILRRVQRRMVVNRVDKLDDYVKRVQGNPEEIRALYQDMLINVTSFFRNPRVFEALKTEVFPKILKGRGGDSAVRIWTVGCASGEETYSIAIALTEYLGDKSAHPPVQLFGTDVSEGSIVKARSGVYPENIQGDVSRERLSRFFKKSEGGYQISKPIRDMCIFAQHNVCNAPPFSQMDLISCRNLLIYLEPALQKKVISLFHYATRPGGYLVLGTSEGVGAATHLFSMEDRTNRILLRKNTGPRPVVAFQLSRDGEDTEYAPEQAASKAGEAGWNSVEAQREFDRRLLNQYATPTVFVNRDMEIVHTRGAVNRYLKIAPGRVSLNILKMAREGLLVDLRSAMSRAQKENVTVRKPNLRVKVGNGNGGEMRTVHLEVTPMLMASLKETYLMVSFTEAPAEAERKPAKRQDGRRPKKTDEMILRMAKLEDELLSTKEYLQSVIETQEATNEELQSANEEILSSNEELQSTNEELETAKEELQSANEELTTVNDELRSRNTEITQGNSDLTNLLSSLDLPMMMVGTDMTIRQFTTQAHALFGLLATDAGRPLVNIKPAVEIPDLQKLVAEVITDLRTIKREVEDNAGNHYVMKILPYRTQENKIEGAVVILTAKGSGSGAVVSV